MVPDAAFNARAESSVGLKFNKNQGRVPSIAQLPVACLISFGRLVVDPLEQRENLPKQKASLRAEFLRLVSLRV